MEEYYPMDSFEWIGFLFVGMWQGVGLPLTREKVRNCRPYLIALVKPPVRLSAERLKELTLILLLASRFP